MAHYVLIQEPRREGVYVQCRDIDQCLVVVDEELKSNLPGTRVTMFRKAPRRTAELLAIWHIESGGARRYAPNPINPQWERWAKRLKKGSVVEFGGHRAKLVTAPKPKGAPPHMQTAKLKIAGDPPFEIEVAKMGPPR